MSYIILIAEDHDDARNFMVFYLHSLGFEVYEATNGNEAVETAFACKPDLILMDISMPVMDGLEATKTIRESGDGISKIPIVAVTAFDDLYKSQAAKAGCDELVKKPVDLDNLESVIHKYLP